MFKNILALIVSLSFSASAFAAIEIQFTPGAVGPMGLSSAGGTSGGIQMIDDGTDSATNWGFTGEGYYGLDDKLQVGGMLSLVDIDGASDMMMSLGVMARYNLDSELRNAIYLTGGVLYSDFGPADSIGVLVGAGKRFALSDTITWTPNVTVLLNVAGDVDKGHSINLNVLSFSGFLD